MSLPAAPGAPGASAAEQGVAVAQLPPPAASASSAAGSSGAHASLSSDFGARRAPVAQQPAGAAPQSAPAVAAAQPAAGEARAESPWPPNPRPRQFMVRRLSVDLLMTYNRINHKYYARKKKKKAVAPDTMDDPNFDYIVRTHEKLNNRYVVDCVIGKGSFGRVVKAYDEINDEYVAIKIVKSKRAFRKQALIEVRILEALQAADPHDQFNVVRMKDTFVHFNHQCIVFELLSMNLYELLRDTRFNGVSLNLIRKFARQLLVTLDFIGRLQSGVIHCDLKPENVLLRNSKHSAIKVIDFGSACFHSERVYTYIQSRFYRAPEVLLGCAYSCAIDMWSLGCILVEMHTGKPLFDGANAHEQVVLQTLCLGYPPADMLARGSKAREYFAQAATGAWTLRRDTVDWEQMVARRRSLRQTIGADTHGPNGLRRHEKLGHTVRDYSNFLDLLQRMLEYDPAQRIKPAEALQHRFFHALKDDGTSTEAAPAAAQPPLIVSAMLPADHPAVAAAQAEQARQQEHLAQAQRLAAAQNRTMPAPPAPADAAAAREAGAHHTRSHSFSGGTAPDVIAAAAAAAAAVQQPPPDEAAPAQQVVQLPPLAGGGGGGKPTPQHPQTPPQGTQFALGSPPVAGAAALSQPPPPPPGF